MPIDQTNRDLLDFVAAVRRDASAAGPFCDWLQDDREGGGSGWDVTLGDVLTLYALPPVPYDLSYYFTADGETIRYDGAEVLNGPAEDNSLRPLLAAWCECHGEKRRAKRAASIIMQQAPIEKEVNVAGLLAPDTWWIMDEEAVVRRNLIQFPLGAVDIVVGKDKACRQLKRRVLQLFREVRVRVRVRSRRCTFTYGGNPDLPLVEQVDSIACPRSIEVDGGTIFPPFKVTPKSKLEDVSSPDDLGFENFAAPAEYLIEGMAAPELLIPPEPWKMDNVWGPSRVGNLGAILEARDLMEEARLVMMRQNAMPPAEPRL